MWATSLHVAALHLSDLDRLKEMASQEGVDPNDPDGLRRIADEGRLGPVTTIRVVGIGVPFDGIVRNEGDDTGSLVLTPAFPDQIRSPLADLSFYYGLVVRLRSLDQLPAFRAAVDAMVPGESFAYRTLPAVRDQVQRTVRPVVVSLTTVATAGFALLLALLVVAMTRVSGATADEQRQWWVLGAVRRERLAGVGAGLGVAVMAGGAMSVVVAWLLSPLGPVGPARLAEPDRGLRFDPEIMLGGAAVLAALGLVLSLLVAWRATRISVRRTARPSRVVDRAAAAGLPGTLVVGLRNALAGPGAVLAALVAVAVGAAVLTFASGVQRFSGTPSLYGWNWDAIVGVSSAPDDERTALQATSDALRDSPIAAQVAMVSLSDVPLDGDVVVAAAFEPVKGTLQPTVASGRLPAGDDEVALGARTMRSLRVDVGDTVATADGRALRVVGRVVLPGFANYSGSDKTTVGEGAVLSVAALRALGPTFLPLGFAVRLAAGATVADLRREGPDLGPLASIEVQEVARPSDVVQLGQLSQVPFMLAAVLATLALVVAVHAVWTAVRRRRREHAVLRALGWRPRDSQASVLWHATSIMVMAIVVGLPLGLIAGRWVWGRLARFLGTVSVSVAPLGTLLAVAGAFGLIAVAGAFVPAQRAGRRPPAADLRTE